MNKVRRAAITEIISGLEDIQGRIGLLYEEESEARDNLPFTMEARIEAADNACENLDEAQSSIDAIIEALTNARDGE